MKHAILRQMLSVLNGRVLTFRRMASSHWCAFDCMHFILKKMTKYFLYFASVFQIDLLECMVAFQAHFSKLFCI